MDMLGFVVQKLFAMQCQMHVWKSSGYSQQRNIFVKQDVKLTEPPDAEPHVRWCERSAAKAASYSIWNFVSRTWLENNKSVRCQLIQLTFSNALKPVAKRIWTSDPSLRRRVLYPAELWRHMPQTLDFTGFLGFFPSAIYKIINSFSSCQSTDFFDLVTLERSPFWGMLCCHH